MTTMMPTADLFDRFLSRPDAIQVLAPGWRSFGGRRAYFGQIATMAPAERGGAARLRDALSQPGEGRVLVVDGEGLDHWAVLGDQLAALGQRHGWSGIVLNGYVRDTAILRTLDIGVHALGAVPSRPAQFDAVERDLPLSFGRVRFVPGDWLYADDDGVIVCAERQDDIGA